MPFNAGATTSIQQQLSADWDNREFNYVISEYVKRIADTVGQFYLSSQNKLATLNDKVTRLERKVEFLEANVSLSIWRVFGSSKKANRQSTIIVRFLAYTWRNSQLGFEMASTRVARLGAETVVKSVTPVSSRTPEQARLGVLQVYKNLQKITPKFWFDYNLVDIPLPVFRNVLKNEFTKNAHHSDLRIIDRKVAECYKDIEAVQMAYYNPEHVRNYLFRENIDPKAKDFLSQFLSGS
ncbi:hypothetical protein M3Y98_00240000 [Aphelenchoides besseyi]|nr:hypothetical protein M3Y98_00240000 [Aphelenchoides besseyi]KAI6200665.1 hypothetical protein M3Y96_00758000 [Aphelenchoides besseyi]